MRVRLQVVNQPSGRPDADRVVDFPDDDTSPISMMFRLGNTPVGSSITQVEGDYVRTWTLLEDEPPPYRELTDAEERAEEMTWD